MESGTYVKHDRDFWIQKWKSFGPGNDLITAKHLWPQHGHNRSGERKEKLEAMIQEGKSPKEIWTSHMKEASKDGHMFKYGPLSNPELKEQLEKAKEDGSADEFWENYWNEAQNDSHIGPKFIDPKSMQKRWEEMKADGKTSEEFWKEEQETFIEKMKGSRWGHHGNWRRHRFWDRGGDHANDEGNTCGYWSLHKKQKDYDEEYIFKEFDF